MYDVRNLKDLVMLYGKEEKRDYSNYKLKVWDGKNNIYRDIVFHEKPDFYGYGARVGTMKQLASASENLRKDFSKRNFKLYAIDRYIPENEKENNKQ